MSRTRWAKGFLRLWLVVSALWVAMSFTLIVGQMGGNPFGQYREAVQKADRLEAEARRVFDETLPTVELGEGISLVPMTDEVLERERKAAVAQAAAQALAARIRSELVQLAGVALLPPLFLFLGGLVTRWVARGFHSHT